MEKFKKVLKVIGIIFISLLFVASLVLDAWYIYIKLRAPKKVISKTFEIDLQETTAGERRPFIEVNWLKNEDGTGVPLLEYKFNYMLDETQGQFYSQGMQYCGEPTWSYYKVGQREESYKSQTEKGFLSKTVYYYHNWFGRYKPNADVYNYMSFDNYTTTLGSSNPINNDTKFKIQIGDELYLMGFRSDNKVTQDANFVERVKGPYENNFFVLNFHYLDYYAYMDYDFFAKTLCNAVKNVKSGTSVYVPFEFGDYFDFYKYNDETKQYIEDSRTQASGTDQSTEEKTGLDGIISSFIQKFKVSEDKRKKIINDLKSYVVIKVNVSSSGAKVATDSMFGCIQNNCNYNTTGEYIANEYFYGKSVKTLSIDDFTAVDDGITNSFKLKLKDSFVEENIKFANNFCLKVEIDLDTVGSVLNFNGFIDKCFDGFNVYKVYTLKTGANGERIKTEVQVC